MFWVICGALVLIVATAILAPFRRQRTEGMRPAAAFDLQVYRDQLREVEQDLVRGVIGPDDAERLRTEIGRKVLDADRRLREAQPRVGRGGMIGAALALLIAIGGAVGLYLREGTPGRPDLSMQTRLAQAQQLYDSRPTQDEAAAMRPDAPPTEPDAEFAALMDKLRQTVVERPNDPQGLILLVRNEARLGNLTAARSAQEKLVALRGDDVPVQELVQLAALMAEEAGGIITPDTEKLLARILQDQPRNPEARYMVGLLQAQNGRPDRTFPIWAELLQEGPETAPWIGPIRMSIEELAWLAGQPDYVPPQPLTTERSPGLPGPDAEAMAAAQDMSPEDRTAFIRDMVSQLEGRLATEGGSPAEWARLIGALVVLGDGEHAREIWTEAQTRFAGQPEAVAMIQDAAKKAGLTQ